MNDTAALVVEGVDFSYPNKKALDGVSFSAALGKCTILLGANGSGKSTLFTLITRLQVASAGTITLCGLDISRQYRRALANLGVVFQQSTLDLDLTVMQNLRYHTAMHGLGRKVANKRIAEELHRFNMGERSGEQVRQLNGGHRRRVEIARALLHHPKVLLLDEPTVGLDIPSRRAIVEYIHQLANTKKISILWATHLLDEIYPGDQIVVLHQGKVKACGNTAAIIRSGNANSLPQAFQKLSDL